MNYKIEFHYKPTDRPRPGDECQDMEIKSLDGSFLAVPGVGDTVSLPWGKGEEEFKVLTRHFSYLDDWCAITIVVTDVESEEMAARYKS